MLQISWWNVTYIIIFSLFPAYKPLCVSFKVRFVDIRLSQDIEAIKSSSLPLRHFNWLPRPPRLFWVRHACYCAYFQLSWRQDKLYQLIEKWCSFFTQADWKCVSTPEQLKVEHPNVMEEIRQISDFITFPSFSHRFDSKDTLPVVKVLKSRHTKCT